MRRRTVVAPRARGDLGPLFDAPVPARRGSDTSQAAARALRADIGRLRRRVADHYAAIWPAAHTPDEAAAALTLSILTVRPRTTELVKSGVLEDTGERRANRSGRQARVLRSVRRAT